MAIRSIQGTHDILPGEVELWQRIEDAIRAVFGRYGFAEIRTPVLEWTELFSRGVGAATELVQKEMDAAETRGALLAASEGLSDLDVFDTASIEGFLRPLATTLDVKVGQLLGTLRVATTGLKVSPPIFETMEALGRDRTLSAIRTAIERL